VRCSQARLGAAAVALLLLVGVTHAGAQDLQVSRSDAGVTVVASGAPIEQVLTRLGEQAGFAVKMEPHPSRPPVDVVIRDRPIDDVLRRVLHDRNYTIAYDRTDAGMQVSRVELLSPRAAAAPQRAPNPPHITVVPPGAAQPARPPQAARGATQVPPPGAAATTASPRVLGGAATTALAAQPRPQRVLGVAAPAAGADGRAQRVLGGTRVAAAQAPQQPPSGR
jgi:hypothetical protein